LGFQLADDDAVEKGKDSLEGRHYYSLN
jgi:hypothetical protein